MSRTNIDPIRAATERSAQQRYVDSLFEPLDPEWNAFPMPFLVEGFLPRGYLCVLASAPKEGKTCLATALALAVATGTPFAGMPTVQSSVLWLASEESRYERSLILKQSPLVDPATPLYTCYEHLPIDREESLDLIMEWVNRTQARLVVVDPLHAATSGRSLQDGWNARRSLQQFKQMFANNGITGLVLHHAKDLAKLRAFARVAENDQLAATASMNIILTSQVSPRLGGGTTKGRGAGGEGHAQLPMPNASPRLGGGTTKGRGAGGEGSGAPDAPYRIVHLHMTGRGDFANRNVALLSYGPLDYEIVDEHGPIAPREAKLDLDEQECVDFIGKTPKHSGQIAVQMRMDDYRLRRLLTRLRQKGAIRLVKSDKWPRRYRLTAAFLKKRAEKLDSN